MPHVGQRRHRRYEVHDVYGSLLFKTRVQVRNLSVSGLALETPERLQLGRRYAIHLAGEKDAVDVSGTIRWCHLESTRSAGGGASGAVYEAGLAFEDVFSEKATGLLGFLEHHAVLSPHQRLTGRFRVEKLASAEIEARYEFEVLRLSLSGMLVRTQLDASLGAAFDLELRLRDGVVPLAGRVAYVKREETERVAAGAQLGMEFLELREPARAELARFIASELEQGQEESPGPDGPPIP